MQNIQPTAHLVVFGSAATGLALAGSDMDLMVMDPSDEHLHDLEADMPGLLFEALRLQGIIDTSEADCRILGETLIKGTYSLGQDPARIHWYILLH